MRFSRIRQDVARYYTEKLDKYGPTPRGTDWNSLESQQLRFQQLLKVCDTRAPFSINDYGCGYGALVDVLDGNGAIEYRGFDISQEMVATAKELHSNLDNCLFVSDESLLKVADYTVASGIFNVKMQTTDEEWTDYVLEGLAKVESLSEKGFAFNALTKYSDADHMRPDLYYADPLFFFDHCKRHFSKFVTLLHDYPLYEFTILVKKA